MPNNVMTHKLIKTPSYLPLYIWKNSVNNAVPINSITNLDKLTQKYYLADRFDEPALLPAGDPGGDIVS